VISNKLLEVISQHKPPQASSSRTRGSRANTSFRRKAEIITLLCNESLSWIPAFARTTLVFSIVLATPPATAQNFDSLLDELSGSEVDQVESEIGDKESEEAHLTPPPSSTELTSTPEDVDFEIEKNIVTSGVTLQGLDKQTARVFIINAAVGQTIEFGTLKIMVQHCERAPLDDRQESVAFVRIIEAKTNSDQQKLFSGWMFSSSPALSALDHPTYDVWVKECKVLENK
jgi:hypothetical protein